MMPLRYALMLSCSLALGIVGNAYAEHLSITLTPHGDPVPNAAATLRIRSLRRTGQSGALPAPVERVLAVGGSASVDLPRGEWMLDVDSESYWHQRQFFATEGNDSDRQVSAPLLRSGIITSTITFRDGSQPKDVTIRFSTIDQSGGRERIEGESVCPVTDKRIRCRVAAGLLDIRLRCEGCIAHYSWEQRVPESGEISVGDLVFDRGAAIVGKIALDRNIRAPMSAVRVRAVPSGTQRPATAAALVSTPNVRGFFHLDGAPPGQYTVTAYGPSSAQSLPTGVTVRGTVEVQLSQPLQVDLPRTLTIDFIPILDPEGRPWSVTLARQVTPRYSEPAGQSAATTRGEWSSQLHPGKYQVNVSSSDGATWVSKDVDLATDEHLPIVLLRRTVHGRLFLGDKPVSANLVFGGEFGSRKLLAHSDAEGKFEVALPSDPDVQGWPLTIEAEVPPVKRTLTVQLPNDPEAELKVILPLTVIFGTVVDTASQPADDVQISAFAEATPLTQVQAGKGGSFAIHGLEPGKYRLQADGYLVQSDTVDVTIPDDGATDELRLVVKPVRKVVGQVLSDVGPVVGADILVKATDAPAVYTIFVETDERGVFSSIAPPSSQQADVFVAAPGFAFRAFHTMLPSGPVKVRVSQDGGALTARWPANRQDAVLIHNGAIIFPGQLTSGWSARMEADNSNNSETLLASPLEPGAYALCILSESERDALRSAASAAATDPRCVNGFLPPYGSTTLDATAAPDRQ